MRKTANPRTTPRLLAREDAVPVRHRLGVERAWRQLNQALTEFTTVCMAYHPDDPRAESVRRLATRVDVVIIGTEDWLATHPGQATEPGRVL